MTTNLVMKPKARTRDARRVEAQRVLGEIESLCEQTPVGGRLPRHDDLIRILGASERTVFGALDELQRRGRVVRRHGSGTYVTNLAAKLSNDVEKGRASTTKTRTITAITIPDRSIFDRAMDSLNKVATEAGFAVTCHFVAPDKLTDFDPSTLGNPFGFVVFRRNLVSLAQHLQAAGNRVVLVAAPFANESFGVPTVCGNQEHGGYISAKHLLDLGHQRIAFVDLTGLLPSHSRMLGYTKAVEEAKREHEDITYEILGADTLRMWKRTPELIRAYFDRSDAPTAIASWNDREALDLIALLRDAGIDVPGRVSIMGYDNLEDGKWLHPRLTTVDSFIELQVSAAVQIINQPEPQNPDRTVVFAPVLLPNGSTAPPRD